MKNRELAAATHTTEHSIKNCLREIYDRLGFDNRIELALWFIKNQEDISPSKSTGTNPLTTDKL